MFINVYHYKRIVKIIHKKIASYILFFNSGFFGNQPEAKKKSDFNPADQIAVEISDFYIDFQPPLLRRQYLGRVDMPSVCYHFNTAAAVICYVLGLVQLSFISEHSFTSILNYLMDI